MRFALHRRATAIRLVFGLTLPGGRIKLMAQAQKFGRLLRNR